MQHVFTANGDSNDMDVLDPTTLQVLASIALPGKPEFMATDGAGTVFGNIESDPGKLVAVDAKTLKVRATWPLAGLFQPHRARHRFSQSSTVLGVCEPGHGGNGLGDRQTGGAGLHR